MDVEEKRNKSLFGRWKIYWDISNVSAVARRYFVMNFTDGLLTTLGILVGFFVLFIANPLQYPLTNIIVLPGIGTAIAMGISGIIGSHLIEEAERAKIIAEMKRSMAIYTENDESDDIENNSTNMKELKEEVLKHMIGLSRKAKDTFIKKQVEIESENQTNKKEKDINEKAEHFATYILAIIDGLSPFLGSIILLVPFLITIDLTFVHFIISFIIIIVTIFFLARYLAKLSEESIFKYFLNFFLAVVITIVLTLTIGQFT